MTEEKQRVTGFLSDDTRSIHERMAAVMGIVHGVEKKSENQQGRYKYAGHEAITAALRGQYVAQGIVRSAHVRAYSREANGCLSVLVAVRWTCANNRDDFWEVDSLGEAPSPTKAREPTGQQAGVAVSYAVKIAELKQFSLTGDATPDTEEQGYDEGSALTDDFVDRFGRCETMADVEALNGEVRKVWREVQSEQARLFAARGEAMKRVGGK